MSDTAKTDDGGPAIKLVHTQSYQGVTVLDYFAAHALQGLLAKMQITEQMVPARQDDIDEIAATAYEIARAMLEVRKATT